MASVRGAAPGLPQTPSDAELVHGARGGDVHGPGLLLARHRPRMFRVTLSVLGHTSDTEDAVQDAALLALRRIGGLRDPDAAGPWLCAIVRNVCRAHLRRRSAAPLDDDVLLGLPSAEPDPDELLDSQALGDWVRHAPDQLSPALRLVTMLRYFTDTASYENIATVCGIPVGTVRSRLNQARAKLGEALLATADTAYDGVRAYSEAHRRDAEEFLRAPYEGRFTEALGALFSPSVETVWPDGRTRRARGAWPARCTTTSTPVCATASSMSSPAGTS